MWAHDEVDLTPEPWHQATVPGSSNASEDQMSERCKQRVYSGARHDFGGHRCTKNAVKDGRCRVHQPEYMEAQRERRSREATERWEAQRRQEALWAIPKLREMGYTVIAPEPPNA